MRISLLRPTFIIIQAMGLLVALGCFLHAQDEPQTVIQIDPQSIEGTISPLIYGTNHRYYENGSGMWNPQTGHAFPKFDQVYDDIGFTAMRYPAGTGGNIFDWKKAIGPMAQRGVYRQNGANGIDKEVVITGPEIPYFGVDEAMQWCERHHTEPVYMYNMANGSAKDAADLVQYLNSPPGSTPSGGGTDWAALRAKNGHPEPYHVKYFEIGNEMYLRGQRFWLADAGKDLVTIKGPEDYWTTRIDAAVKAYAFGLTTPTAHHDGYVDYYGAMKAVDPSIKVYSCFGFPNFIDLMGADHPYDGVVMHEYSHLAEKLSPVDYHDRLMQAACDRINEIRRMQDYMRQKVGEPRAQDMFVIVTEYGMSAKLKNTPAPEYLKSLDHALYIAATLMGFMQTGMPHAEKMCTIEATRKGSQGVIGAPPDFTPTASALAFKMFTHQFGNQLIKTTVEQMPAKSVKGHDLSLLQIAASTDSQGHAYLMVVNFDAEKDHAARIEINKGDAIRSAEIWTLNGARFTSFNSPSDPDAVKITTSNKDVAGSSLDYVFPAHSITSFRF